MKSRTVTLFLFASLLIVGWMTLSPRSAAQQTRSGLPALNNATIAGSVRSSNGPEAGVWVIAETTELPTRFVKIVVTDDQGRYVLPDLPKANYSLWVRGYGLLDSKPVQGSPGKAVDLTAVVAPSPITAAQYYPSNYWYSMLRFPSAEDLPGANKIPATFKTQQEWLDGVKNCLNCHQIGNKATREIPEKLGKFTNSEAAWAHRITVGQAGSVMAGQVGRLGGTRFTKMLAEWTDRIAAGELPAQSPSRPTGQERNLVVTMWDWGTTPEEFVHDEIVSDKRDPRVNANGPVYGVASGSDGLVWVDPVENKAYQVKLPTNNPRLTGPLGSKVNVPSPYMGDELYWHNPAYPHNPMMDSKGRVWITATTRDPETKPDFCKPESGNKFAQYFAPTRSSKQLEVFDPRSKQFEMIETCFSTHHLEFDSQDTIAFSNLGGGDVVGWVDTRIFDKTHDSAAAQGWCPAVLDTNGDGKISKGWTEPNEAIDPARDHRVAISWYGNAVNPVDGSYWGANAGGILRLERGSNPPESCKTEKYEAPPNTAFFPHGIDFDSNGIAWVNFPSSGHIGSFDRSKCKVLNGPTATGQHCPEGWTFYRIPGPTMTGRPDISSDWTYIVWVDRFNTLGMGKDSVITTGTNSDSMYVFSPATKTWLTLRVPYPLTYYARGNDGRIDDPNAGWKGRGVWSNYGNTNNWHIEGGKGTHSKIVKFQMRPSPIAN